MRQVYDKQLEEKLVKPASIICLNFCLPLASGYSRSYILVFIGGPGVSVDQAKFLSLCNSVAEAAHSDLSNEDRAKLIALHRALSELKIAVEKALLSGSREERLAG